MNALTQNHSFSRMLRRIFRSIFFRFARVYNAFHALRARPKVRQTGWAELDEILERSLQNTDISDHLPTLFVESLSLGNGLIVELGIRGGESTFVLERVAKLTRSQLISVDIADCSNVSSAPDWIFVQQDDIAFGQQFKAWCEGRGIEPTIHTLFIDTSHEYEHTLREIKVWFPYLADRSKVFFHDTNGTILYYFRRDGSMGVPDLYAGRDVMDALEKYFGVKFDEKRDFVDYRKGWLIKHHANSNGFTVLERVNA